MQQLLLSAVNVFFQVIYIFILIRIFLSWIPGARETGFANIIYQMTEPILGPVRSMLDNSPIGGGMMLDISPVIALFIMDVVKMILQSVILML